MYLTFYKQTQTNINNIEYNNIMRTNPTEIRITHYKTTVHIKHPTPKNTLKPDQLKKIIYTHQQIDAAYQILKPFENNHEEQYYEFQIPKRSGGLRTINAPNPKFKEALSKVKDIFEQNLKCLAHNSAYAYIKHRSVKDALAIHQKNQSNWYLKIDLTDFFPSCTPELIFNNLKQLYPFYYIDKPFDELLKKIIKICCLHGGLPQGTPISPLLTNLIMIPYDYAINNTLKRGLGEHFVYTRYADDILISSKSNFDWQKIQQTLENLLTPFKIKKQKTRYGSKNGSNWNLGLMLNKDNNITLGSSKKRLINAMLNNLCRDYRNLNIHGHWTKEDIQCVLGHLSYLKHIEPDYYEHMIDKYETKYNTRNIYSIIDAALIVV